MSKRNLLEMTQDILTIMESDVVNSIGDTEESRGVAEIIRSTYFDLRSNRNWPDSKQLLKLESLADPERPTHMRLPENVTELLTLNYNKMKVGETQKRYEPLQWKEPDDFLRYSNQLNNTASNVKVVQDISGVELLIRTDKHPDCYTSFDDEHVVYDSHDSSVDTTLQASKVQAMGYVFPVFELEDSFIPDIPVEAFAGLQAEARSRCQYWFKDFRDAKSEQESARQQRWLSRKAWRVSGGIKMPDYGRKGRGRSSEPTFRKRTD